ncbi:MAG: M61 family metallopeptidase [Proteobacteria bacterium]|nr:M61 family metallopeptidase [Pseudomonadota bacterium]
MISYRITIAEPHAHAFDVTVRVPDPAPDQRLGLPVWIPGSYLVREFARHLSGLEARQGDRRVELQQLDKASWRAACRGRGALVVRYRVHAYDTSVRGAYLDAARGFVNPACVCLRVEGRHDEPHALTIGALPSRWEIAAALPPAKGNVLTAADYDELADTPIELGRFRRTAFEAGGVPHELVVTGAWPDADLERLRADCARICAAQIRFWHGDGDDAQAPPFARYLLLLNLVEDGHGGLEHRASTALLAARRDMPVRGRAETSDGYAKLLGLVSHEYFHAWNVKRLRPIELATIDYARENYTTLLWFFEGFTSYYDDLIVLRAGLIDAARYLQLVARNVSAVLGTPGRLVQSLAQASFDAWVKFYRSDENTPNATISYYAKGALVALALDLTLRREGRGTLDDVMRRLWAASGHGGPIGEYDIRAALREVGGRAYDTELDAWVHGTDDPPLADLFDAFGVQWQAAPATLAQRLGVRVAESALTGIKVSHVLRGGAAERAGIAPGDEVLAVQGWRVRRLDEALHVLEPGQPVPLLVARDQRVLGLELVLPDPAEAGGSVALQIVAEPSAPARARRQAWLGS